MHSRLQELKKEEETLLKIKVMLQDQLNRLKVKVGPSKGLEHECVGVHMFVLHKLHLLCVPFAFQFEEGALKSIINAQTEEEGGSQRLSPEAEVGQREKQG